MKTHVRILRLIPFLGILWLSGCGYTVVKRGYVYPKPEPAKEESVDVDDMVEKLCGTWEGPAKCYVESPVEPDKMIRMEFSRNGEWWIETEKETTTGNWSPRVIDVRFGIYVDIKEPYNPWESWGGWYRVEFLDSTLSISFHRLVGGCKLVLARIHNEVKH